MYDKYDQWNLHEVQIVISVTFFKRYNVVTLGEIIITHCITTLPCTVCQLFCRVYCSPELEISVGGGYGSSKVLYHSHAISSRNYEMIVK